MRALSPLVASAVLLDLETLSPLEGSLLPPCTRLHNSQRPELPLRPAFCVWLRLSDDELEFVSRFVATVLVLHDLLARGLHSTSRLAGSSA